MSGSRLLVADPSSDRLQAAIGILVSAGAKVLCQRYLSLDEDGCARSLPEDILAENLERAYLVASEDEPVEAWSPASLSAGQFSLALLSHTLTAVVEPELSMGCVAKFAMGELQGLKVGNPGGPEALAGHLLSEISHLREQSPA